jgi:hypothetical protein
MYSALQFSVIRNTIKQYNLRLDLNQEKRDYHVFIYNLYQSTVITGIAWGNYSLFPDGIPLRQHIPSGKQQYSQPTQRQPCLLNLNTLYQTAHTHSATSCEWCTVLLPRNGFKLLIPWMWYWDKYEMTKRTDFDTLFYFYLHIYNAVHPDRIHNFTNDPDKK